jgi:dipeptidyl aminopeptidase/acylaminoacyl peptidase
VAYVVARMDLDEDVTTTAIHVLDLADGTTRAFTTGDGDGSPRWSPDGARLAFLRSPSPGEPSQLAVLDLAGGEAVTLTSFALGVSEHDWTPDGTRIVVAGTEWRPGWDDRDDDERARQPRRITELGYRFDDRGWLHDRVTRLWVVDPDGEQDTRALTPADHSVAGLAVTDDAVVFASRRNEDRETEPGTPLFHVPLDGGELEQLVGPGDWNRPVRAVRAVRAGRDARDGSGGVLLTGLEDGLAWPQPHRLHRIARDGEVVDLAPDLDRDLAGEPQPLDDGRVLVLMEDRGAVHLVAVAPDGSHEVVVGGAQTVTGFDASADGSRIVYAATHPTDPGEVWLLQDGTARVVTSHNEQLRDVLLPVEHFTFERDGAELDAWAVMPDAGAGDGVPLLVNIHGGPTAQYGHAFFDEFQVEAGAGYAVVACNPRGSSGRGAAWSTAVVGAWVDEDSVDILDLEAVADAALARYDRIDPERLGIMGGSYGGYATARILARTERYGSAIVERGLLSWPSFGGTSDIGAFFDRMFLQRTLPGDAADQWEASPVRTADRITTPTLVLHSLQDHRCPPEQALQFFSMLRRHGVESELVLFPDEGHEMSRSGSPRHRVERFEAVLDWHDRHLG